MSAAAVRDEAAGRSSLVRDWLPVVGLLVGLLVGMKLLVADPIERRLERMETRINGRIERVEARLYERFDGVDERLDRIDAPDLLPGSLPVVPSPDKP